MLSPALLRGLRLGRARDLGDAFATAGGCLDAGWGPRAPRQAEMGTQSRCASAWSHSDLTFSLSKTQSSPNAHPGRLSRSTLTAVRHKGMSGG